MKNRIKNYGGNDMEENINLAEIAQTLENADGYMLAVSILKEGKVTPYLLTHKYEKLDMLKQLKKIREIAVARLEVED